MSVEITDERYIELRLKDAGIGNEQVWMACETIMFCVFLCFIATMYWIGVNA